MRYSKMQTGALLALLASVLMIPSTGGQESSKEKADPAVVAKLIKQLGSDDFQTREKASRQLAELEEVPDALRQAAEDSDREISRRAQAAITIITDRVEERAFQAIVRDLHKVELDRFVRRMVTDNKFAGDKQWKIIQAVAKAVTDEANKLAGRPIRVPDFSAKPMQRELLSAENSNFRGGHNSLLLCTGTLPRITSIRNSLVIVDGDFAGATGIDSSLLIVRGNVGRVTSVTNSILLATGDWIGATGLDGSFVQVNNSRIRFTGSKDSVFVNTIVRTTGNTNSRVINTDKGPLQLLKFSPRPDAPKLAWSEEVDNLTVALTSLDGDGKFLIRWKNVGKEDLQLPWARLQINRLGGNDDDLLDHVFLKGPGGKLAPARQYRPLQRASNRLPGEAILLGPGRTFEETINLWSYVEKPAVGKDYQLSIELDISSGRRGRESRVKTWSGKIQSKTLKVAVGK